MFRIAPLVVALGCSSSPSPKPGPTPAPRIETPPPDRAEPPVTGSCTPEEGGDSFGAMSNERFGDLRLGAEVDQVTAMLGDPEEISGPVSNDGVGTVNWTWTYASKGLEIEIGAEDKNAPKRVSAIVVGPGSTLKTRFGIGVGSPVADVEKAYGPCISREESSPETLVAGTLYGGVFFSIEDGQVRTIFVGAGAE